MSFLAQAFSGGTTNGTATTVPTNQNIINPYQNAAAYNQAATGTTNQLGNQQALQQSLAGQGGLQNQSSVFNQQQGLVNALQNEAAGGGPNPAQAALAQNTGANVQNQAALMAGQRGASANPALIAQMAAQQGAATQQGAVGQAATLQAQQQLAAQGQLQQQQQNMSGLATTQAGQQIGNQNALTGQSLANQQAIGGVMGQQNATQAGIQNTQQAGQNQLNNTNLSGAYGLLNQGLSAIGSAVGIPGGGGGQAGAAAGGAKGGLVEHNSINPKLNAVPSYDRFALGGMVPPHLKTIASLYHGDSYKTPRYQEQTKMSSGGLTTVGSQLKSGGHVPGQALIAGDSEKNDTVRANLSPGEFVIKKSIMESDDPVQGAAKAVADSLKKKGKDSGKQVGEFKEALKRAIAGRKSK